MSQPIKNIANYDDKNPLELPKKQYEDNLTQFQKEIE
jgi:hypothetical protein